MKTSRFTVIILAAGLSSRMNGFKPLLPIGGKTVIEHTIEIFTKNGINDIRVITGHRAFDVKKALSSSDVTIVENPDYQSGMYSSVKTGVKSIINQPIDAFFIIPADICLVRPLTVKWLITAYDKYPGKIIHPCFEGTRGHPPLIPIVLARKILDNDPEGGLKTILDQHNNMAMDIQVPDQHVLLNMNCQKDYQNALVRYQNHDIPSSDECEILMKHFCSDYREIAAHCRKVKMISLMLCHALVERGCRLNPDLTASAALLHDIAKGHENHAHAGAQILSEMGFSRVADIVSQHTNLDFHPEAAINEAEIVYFADKLTLKDRMTTLEHRFNLSLKRFGNDPEIEKSILKRKQIAVSVKQKLEQALAVPVESVINQNRMK